MLWAAEELGYRPHRAALTMRKGRSNLIGIIHFHTIYEIAQQAARFLPVAIHEYGYETLTVDLGWQGNDYQNAIHQLISARVEGVIIIQTVESFTQKEIALFTKVGIPVVAVSGSLEWGVPSIRSDIQSGIKDLSTHLISQGHKKLLLLVPDYHSGATRSRVAGFRQGIEDAGGEMMDSGTRKEWLFSNEENGISGWVEAVHDGDKPAYWFTHTLLKEGKLPDAIMCSNDHWARWVFSALLEAGLSAPEDVALTGVDNEEFGAYPPYYLTTLAQPRAKQCAQAVELLMKMLQGDVEALDPYTIPHPCELIIRKSCGASREKENATSTCEQTNVVNPSNK